MKSFHVWWYFNDYTIQTTLESSLSSFTHRAVSWLYTRVLWHTCCLTDKSMSWIRHPNQNKFNIVSPWGEIIIPQCAKWTILFVWQQSINHKSCVTIQKIKLSFGRCPRTSICQNKWILFSKYIINKPVMVHGWNEKGTRAKSCGIWTDKSVAILFGKKQEKKTTKWFLIISWEILALFQTANYVTYCINILMFKQLRQGK